MSLNVVVGFASTPQQALTMACDAKTCMRTYNTVVWRTGFMKDQTTTLYQQSCLFQYLLPYRMWHWIIWVLPLC